jgi:hypothetical protein
MLVKEHPEVQPLVAEYVHMTLLEKLRYRLIRAGEVAWFHLMGRPARWVTHK